MQILIFFHRLTHNHSSAKNVAVKKKGVWNFLLILALSGLDITLIQVSKALQNETYLPLNKQDIWRIIGEHLIEICIQRQTEFWMS